MRSCEGVIIPLFISLLCGGYTSGHIGSKICEIKYCISIVLHYINCTLFLFSPCIDVCVVAGLEDAWDAVFFTLIQNGFGAGVDGRGGNTAFFYRSVLAEDAWQATRDGINDCERRHLPACVDRFAYGELFYGPYSF